MRPLLERIRQGDVLLADGAMGTLLLGAGLKPGGCPESLNLDRPELLEEIARNYFNAGAEIIQTNTFGAAALKLAAYGLAEQTEEINRGAVQAVRRAIGDKAYVCACCGPSGKLLKPYGDTDPEVIAQSFERQLRALVKAGIDAVNFETMIDLSEAEIAVKAARSVASKLTVVATMTFQPTRRGLFTIMGNTVPEAARRLTAAGADVVGSNCGNGIELMVEIAREFRKAGTMPVSIRPNAGIPQLVAGRPVYPETPEFMAARIPDLVRAGVSIIGGCCGTTPEHIQAFRAALDPLRT
ncbi:MAG: homocysteine S-methyltransferase family protein [candidate division WOR-3 bacterium]|nr:homocysteine S-methyltransferase family protein [candidate division WOR-3 bacterium]